MQLLALATRGVGTAAYRTADVAGLMAMVQCCVLVAYTWWRIEIADACRFQLDDLKNEYPDEPIPPGKTAAQHLEDLTMAGARMRYPRGIPKAPDNRGLYVGQATDAIVDAVTRLLDLMARPDDAELLGPLVVDEILIRLLRTHIGSRVAQIGQPKSGVQRVARAVSWIREHFAQPVTVQDMAASVHMSASSFHQQFRAVTSMSPLQYQKVLRLHEARRLMLFQKMDANDACRRAGYLSASQFSREYARFFGSAPTRDIARLRETGRTPVEAAR